MIGVLLQFGSCCDRGGAHSWELLADGSVQKGRTVKFLLCIEFQAPTIQACTTK